MHRKGTELYAGVCRVQATSTPAEATSKLYSQAEFQQIQATLRMKLISQEPQESLGLVLTAFSFPPEYPASALTLNVRCMVPSSPKPASRPDYFIYVYHFKEHP